MINSPWFAKTDIILFLNKDDLFSEKIKKISLKRPDLNWFMDYEGGNDASKAYKYVLFHGRRFVVEDKVPVHLRRGC